MKKTIQLLLFLFLLTTVIEATNTHQHKSIAKSTKKVKPKKRYISEWRKAQWRKARLAKKSKKAKPKRYISEWRKAQWRKERLAKQKKAHTKSKTKKKKYISEWRKAQWRKARLAKQKKAHSKSKTKKKKYVSEWRKAQWRKARLAKQKKIHSKSKRKRQKRKKLSKYELKKINKIYKKVAKKTHINKKALSRAFRYYKKNKSRKGLSSKYLAIADYTKTARKKRLYIISLKNGKTYQYKVAHGKYSGKIGGKVRRSSNRRNSKMTPYGFFKVGSKVRRTRKKRYQYLSVKGLQRSNRKVGVPARYGGRDVVLHPAKYVNRGGRSHGCFSICPKDRYRIFSKLKRALLYSYTGR